MKISHLVPKLLHANNTQAHEKDHVSNVFSLQNEERCRGLL